jgi:hypothetical protein
MAAEEKMKDGMIRNDALRAVRLERGGVEITKEVVRSAGWESFVETSLLRIVHKTDRGSACAATVVARATGGTTA